VTQNRRSKNSSTKVKTLCRCG